MKKLLNNKKVIILVSILLIVAILIYGINKYNSHNYNNMKIDKTKNFVFTSSTIQSENYIQERPFINIKGYSIEIINKDIDKFLDTFTEDNIEMKYEYDINGEVLSLILKVEDHSLAQSATITAFKSYNINIKTKELLPNEKVLDLFNTTEEDIEKIIKKETKDYYNNLVSNNNISINECDYNCYIKNRNIENCLDGIELYIRDGNLIVFKPMTFIPLYDDEEIIKEYEIVKVN